MKNWIMKLIRGAVVPLPSRSPASLPAHEFPAPWEAGRPAIYRFLCSFNVAGDAALPEDAHTLPDEPLLLARQGGGLRWVPGALDGASGHHGGGRSPEDVGPVVHALVDAARTRSAGSLAALYELIASDGALGLVDPLLERVSTTEALDAADLHALARWLATESPDRGAVKVAIALLGMLTPARDTDLLITLGLHEEFTLYVAVALANTLPDAQEREAAWWSLARRVNGWGRIHLVERLAHTRRAGIKAWLLREGYRNSIMTEYLAHACATGGELLAALNDEQIDDALLQGAGDLIQALIDGGPAPGMDDYADGAAATERYMHHLALRRPDWLDAYLATDSIATFAGDTTRDWAALQALGWTPARRASIVEQARAIMQDERWRPLAQDGLSAGDGAEFQRAARAAQKLGLDAWSARLRRQEALGDANEWWHLMQTDDPQRIDQVITLAHRQIDLAQVATGPGTLMGLGPEFRQHSALDMILQDLGRFPGRGWTLVQAGLRSPVVRNRHMALRALDGWGRERWPAEARALLRAALNVEPDDRVRAGIENVLEGHRPA